MSNDNGNTADCEPATAAHGSAQPDTAKNHILSLAVVARMFKIPPLALRLFELRGLIRRHLAGNVWVYSWSDCERIALLVKARKAGLTVRDLAAVLKAMDEEAPNPVADDGRLQCLALIHKLESRKKSIGNALDELYRIDWELSERLGVEGSLDKGASFDTV